MEAKGSIAEALFEKHLDLRGAPTPHRELLEVLFEMGELGCLSEEDRTVVVNDMSVFEKVSRVLTFCSTQRVISS